MNQFAMWLGYIFMIFGGVATALTLLVFIWLLLMKKTVLSTEEGKIITTLLWNFCSLRRENEKLSERVSLGPREESLTDGAGI